MSDPKDQIKGARILVVDDHRNIRLSLKLTLEEEGAKLTEADSFKGGLAKLGALQTGGPFPYDAMLFDVRLPDGSGLELLERVKQIDVASRVIMISGEGTMSEAFKATQMGAFDFVEKPFTSERILVAVRRCLSFNNIRVQNEDLTRKMLKGQEILGSDPAINELRQTISRVARTNSRVLIRGESGTGKELVARAVHRESTRSHKDLIKVNCAAIPHSLVESELFGHEKGAFTGASKARRGLFEQADGGTLFLDEIGELSLDVQAKLLRVLQNGELIRIGSEQIIKVDVRILAATHRDLEEMVQNGEFREDLFYRLNVISLKMPPLRERGQDIASLAAFLLEEACEEHSVGFRQFSERAIQQLMGYSWPGNIRELRNLIERVAILSETQLIDDIPELAKELRPVAQESDNRNDPHDVPAPPTSGDAFAFATGIMPWQEFHSAIGKSYIKYVLKHCDGNVSEAARTLCLERAYLHRLMKKLGIQRGVVVSD